MVTNSLQNWRVRLCTFILWAVAGACLVFWTLRLASPVEAAMVAVAAPGPVAVDLQALAQVLGAGPAAPTAQAPVAPSRYTLQGLLAGRDSGRGAAVIGVNGQPARAFPVGAQVDQGLVLQSVGVQQARLGPSRQGEATVTLELPIKK
ncbi:MAG: type II secretion system protein N [Comamonas sp.]